ncbi:Galactose/methyl galactoside import ATP-binding protein MglA [Klebsiella pneumoniae]|nr:Galactose/methyl galactoside import ATP-binding protein MglA [Klebsiella pneumoniae]
MSPLTCIRAKFSVSPVGAKRTDIVETLFGIREKASGTITLHGKKINNHSANEAINHGFALVTEERRSTGIYAYLDIGFNSLISNIKKYKTASACWITRE